MDRHARSHRAALAVTIFAVAIAVALYPQDGTAHNAILKLFGGFADPAHFARQKKCPSLERQPAANKTAETDTPVRQHVNTALRKDNARYDFCFAFLGVAGPRRVIFSPAARLMPLAIKGVER